MSILPTTASLTNATTWDGDRRVAGGPLVSDPPTPQGEDELSFGDFLSILNPLQHIPVVSTLYRWVTGDTLKPAARVVGGAIYGGPVGLVTSAINAIVDQVKGGDLGAQLIAMVAPDRKGEPASAAAAIADASAAETTAPAEGADALLQLAADLRSRETAAEEPKPQPAAAPILPGHARTLAFYQAHAGQRLPNFDGGRSGPAPKYTVPAAAQIAAAKPLPIAPADEKSGAADIAVPQEGSPDSWFAAVMMRGLDQYRASQQLNRTPPQLDVSQ